MKKHLLVFTAILTLIITTAKSQTVAPGPVERRLADNICSSLSKLDLSKITTKSEAVKAYTSCVMAHADMLPDLAAEKKVDMTDQAAMRLVGIELGKDLMKQNCKYFLQLSTAMAKKEDSEEAATSSTLGTFKRIDLKGFNYIVIKDDQDTEKSFLWFGNFPGSEKFIKTPALLLNKKLKITWAPKEVYMPEAKGYYTIKEILRVDFL